MNRSPTIRRLLLLAALGVTAMLLCLRSPHQPGHYPPCPVAALTGLHCPGCGTLRGLHALLHGDLLQAFAAMVLSLGRRITVHKPAELRDIFRELAQQALQAAQPPD